MSLLDHALQGARHALPPAAPQPLPLGSLLVVGGGGTLGSAVLAQALVPGRFARVLALVARPLRSTLRGLQPLPQPALAQPGAWQADGAVIVLQRQRHSNGRDDAFVQPAVAGLLPLAQALHRQGVRQLIVVVPHAPALLPQALQHGFASLDEGAVAALGFAHLVFVRAAQPGATAGGAGALQRFAGWWLSQLRWMVPQQEQALRAAELARCVVLLARQLPAATPGTRVLAPGVLWQLTQAPTAANAASRLGLHAGQHASLQAWLQGRPGAAPPP